MKAWIIRENKTKYPDLFTYTILEPNPDASKSGVCYSGQYLAVTELDSRESAELIVFAVNSCIAINPDNPLAAAESIGGMYEALKAWMIYAESNYSGDGMTAVSLSKVALAKAEGK